MYLGKCNRMFFLVFIAVKYTERNIQSLSGVPGALPKASGGAGGHFLADQLTLSQPGGHIIPTEYYVPPQIFRPCDGRLL